MTNRNRLDPRVLLPALPTGVGKVEHADDLVSQAMGTRRISWDCMFGGDPIIIEIHPDGRCSVNGDFVETPTETAAAYVASVLKA